LLLLLNASNVHPSAAPRQQTSKTDHERAWEQERRIAAFNFFVRDMVAKVRQKNPQIDHQRSSPSPLHTRMRMLGICVAVLQPASLCQLAIPQREP